MSTFGDFSESRIVFAKRRMKLKQKEVFMNGQPSPEGVRVMRGRERRKSILTASFLFMRLFLAFVCGWFLAVFLVAGNGLLFIAFPPVLGVLAALTVPKQNPRLISLSIWTGLSAVAGMYAYGFPVAVHQDAQMDASCPDPNSYCQGSHNIYLVLLTLFLLYGVVIVLLSTGIKGFFIKKEFERKTRHHLPENPNKEG
jgi:hypothetical protein